ncbi:HAMP domain-containing histidine kinase [Ruminiclostridium herbifermentans]|uniref:histidine kinase n=1 Tax=Ruminiclostridium herbifermentans TaxID=2488810 RepID=A0A4U7JHN2_9FIRM|nr:HAMP domain-containing sensor histidine kinase [Ruminiclostridium herbifermentans]QNU66103.1 HAMP domain-containing histidine kinase [Ruminiclostridium herbifermentans]
MDKLKLQWKIFGFLFGFCALLLVILWIFQTVFLSDMYKFIRKVEIDKAITLVEKNINSTKLQDVLNELEVTKEIIVRPTQGFAPPERPIPDKRIRKQPETITKAKEFVLEDGSKISLTFHAMITPVDATVSTLRMQLFVITGIMVLLATLLAIIISKHISKPIVQINQSAKVLAMGNYETKFNGRGFLEIKELSDTLNTAALELSKVEQLRRELMANVSHDLRTPLAFIYSYAEMMHDFPQEVTSEQSQIIMDEAKRLTALVNDMLDISSLETGIAKLNKVNYNLTESLRKTILRMKELVKNDGYQLELENAEDVCIFADEVKITQAIYNLLFNAITYSGDDKKVIVRQSVNGNVVRIEIIDHGEGISKSDLPYIWERYYKVDKKHKRPKMGTGIGLSIVKKIVELHKGEYGVESEVGKGSTFWFQLRIE